MNSLIIQLIVFDYFRPPPIIAILLESTFLTITQFAPILAFWPTFILPINFAPHPIYTLSTILGAPYLLLSLRVLLPIVT